MYFSRVTLRTGDGARRVGRLLGGGYRTHQAVWTLFGDHPERQRDFLYRQENTGIQTRFYVVSERPPEDENGIWEVQCKRYAPRLEAGQRLGFSLRVNAVVTIKDQRGHSRRHDIVMHARHEGGRQGAESRQEIAARVGPPWLVTRGRTHGFELDPDAVQVESYQQHRLLSSGHGKPIQLSTLDFTGLLTVVDPGRFESTLYNGIGPAKAFGCGLLLVRRP